MASHEKSIMIQTGFYFEISFSTLKSATKKERENSFLSFVKEREERKRMERRRERERGEINKKEIRN